MSATAQEHGAGWGDIGPAAGAEAFGGIEALTSAHSQGRERAEAGDLTGARTLLEEALAAAELRLGRDNPRLAPLMVDLATIARNVGNLTEAQIQLKRAYGIVVSSTGPEHATALSIEGRLAAVCYRLGEPTEAYDWHIADVGPRVLGTEHPAVRGAQQRLSLVPAVVPTQFDPGQYDDEPTDSPVSGGWAPPSYEAGSYGADTDEAAAPYQASPYQRAPHPPAVYDYEDDPADNFTPSYAPGVYHRRDAGRATVGAPPLQDEVELWREQPRSTEYISQQPSRRGQFTGIALVLSLGVAVIIGALVIGVLLFAPDGKAPSSVAGAPTSGPAPTTAPPSNAPTGVTIVDHGGSVTLTWADPSAGRVPFIVAGGRDGTTSAPLESVPAGRTTSTIYGLNDRFDYCFTVAAVWSSEDIQPSMRTCTHRLSTSGAPSVPITASTA